MAKAPKQIEPAAVEVAVGGALEAQEAPQVAIDGALEAPVEAPVDPVEPVVEAPAEPEAPKGKPLADHAAYRVDH